MNIKIQIIVPTVIALAATACIPKADGGGATPGGGVDPAALTKCGPEGVIDDGEDNNHQGAPNKGRGGYWFTFVDKGGSTITPTAGEQGGTFSMSPGGANGSSFSARFSGKLGNGNPTFAGAGLNFVDPKGPYDVSSYKGISFWAKKAEGSTGKVRVKLPDANTDPDGKVCSECFNDFGADIEVTTAWTQFTLPFASMTQMSGWGSPRPGALETKKVYAVQWQVNSPGESYDISIDDIQFVGCP
jgi:endoglucanase